MATPIMFKPGDIVHIRRDLTPGRIYGGASFYGAMTDFRGKDVRILDVNGDRFSVDGITSGLGPYLWTREMVAGGTDDPKIVVTTDGKRTRARFYYGNRLVRDETSSCHPDDDFDFTVGAKLAFDRLLDQGETRKEIDVSRYCGQIICVHSLIDAFKAGKIYAVRFGQLVTECGDTINIPAVSFSGVAYYLAHHKYDGASFIELIED